MKPEVLMTRAAAIALLALLAGCATPQEMREGSERRDWTSARAPADVARCIARHAEENTPLAYPQATVREGSANGSLEVQVRHGDHTSFVADVLPSGAGSRVTLYRYRGMISTVNMPAAMAKGC